MGSGQWRRPNFPLLLVNDVIDQFDQFFWFRQAESLRPDSLWFIADNDD
jgi:hypothetical protein